MSLHTRVLRSLGKGPVRRNLFGPVDHKQLQQDFHTAIKQDLEEASQRWGFNFLTEMPLDDSNFQWEGVSGEKVPPVYRSSRKRRNLGSFREESTLSEVSVSMETGSVSAEAAPGTFQSGKENAPRTPKKHTNNLKGQERTPVKKAGNSNILKRKQTNIKDFYLAKKRNVGSSRKSGQ